MLKPAVDLTAHDERLQTSLARPHEAVVVTDATGRVTFMNAAAQALTGWEPAAAQGRAVEDVVRVVISRGTGPPPRGAVGVAWPTDQSYDLAGHYLWRADDGTALPIDGRATPMRNSAGHLLGAVWVFRDPTADQQLLAEHIIMGTPQRSFAHPQPEVMHLLIKLRTEHAGAVMNQKAVAVLSRNLFAHSQAGMARRWWKIGHLAPGRRCP